MTVSERRKGIKGQQEVQRMIRERGFELRKLGGQGDALVGTKSGARLHFETKRQERPRPGEWIRQAKDEAPHGAVPVVAWRQSGGEWYAILPLADLLRLAE